MSDNGFTWRGVILFLVVLSSGSLYYFSTGVEGFRPLVWIAPVPILAYSLFASRKLALTAAFIVYFLGSLSIASFLLRITPLFIILLSSILTSSVFTLCIAGFRFSAKRYSNIIPAIFFASLWTSWEFLLSQISPHGTALNIAYTQSDFLPFVQLASVTGIWGLVFLLLFFPAAMVIAWKNRNDKLKSLQIILVPVIILFIVFTSGFIRIHKPVYEKSILAGLAASDTSVRFFSTADRHEALAVIRAFEKRIDLLAAKGARVIVLPEKFVGVTPEYYEVIVNHLQQSSIRNKVFIAAGLNLTSPDKNRNIALVISPEGKILSDYDKVYFIPGVETGYSRGTKPGIFKMMDMVTGIQICKDLDFPQWSRKYSKDGARIILVPAWDFTADAWLHSRMAMIRAVENGFSMIRCAQQGNLTIADFRGKILAENSTIGKQEVLVLGKVYPGPGHTFYSLTGNWFAWINVLFIIAILVYPQVDYLMNER